MNDTRTIVCKVVGTTFENRQSILSQMTGKEPCRLEPQPDNVYDKNAIGVMAALDGKIEQISFLSREFAAKVAPYLDGESIMCEIIEMVGGFEMYSGETAALGVRIRITLPDLAETVYRETPDNVDPPGTIHERSWSNWSEPTRETPSDYDLPDGDYNGD